MKTLKERFDEKYSPEPNSGCWLWTATQNHKRYGLFWLEGRKMRGAHRISWLIHRGAIGENQQVLHKCDTPECVNPDHLFLGTHQDNMDDMKSKGRQVSRHGSANGWAKLDEQQVRCIDLMLKRSGYTQKRIAEYFNVVPTTISNIARGKTYSISGA